jgi:ribonucleoside-triphosphate reductase
VSDIITKDFIEKYSGRMAPFGGNGVGYLTYKRTYAREVPGEDRTEDWHETIARCINGAQAIGADYTKEEAQRLFDYMFNLKGSFAGRCLWQLGTPMIEKYGGPSLLNCWYVDINSIRSFEFVMHHLAMGGGVGFSIERSIVHDFPKVKENVTIRHDRTADADFIVPDSREGWVSLLREVLQSFFFTGKSFSYSTILIRGYGAPLKTFGGTASGPEILIEGMTNISSILSARAGKKIRSIDALDICNVIGKVIVAGSARRSAQIGIGDCDDYLYLRAKRWSTHNIPAYRSNSNNSIYADSYDEIIDEFWKNYDGGSEPYGLINRKLARKNGRLGELVDDSRVNGVNPCGEIFLESGESCNLGEIFLPRIASKKELIDISKLIYKTQKAITTLRFPFRETEEVVQRNRRLGLGITGWLQATPDQVSWLDECYKELRAFDIEWSKKKGINPSIKLTTTKPSGTLSLLPFVTPGIHPAYDQYFIRRIRIGSNDPLVQVCRDNGYNVQYDIQLDGTENHRLCVVDFPCSVPEGTKLANEMTAIEQLEWVVKAQTVWSDNAVSVTVYYKKEELEDIKIWLKKNYSTKIKSVSFLLHSDHNFPLPPYEAISKEQFVKMQSKVKPFGSLSRVDSAEIDSECDSGACPIK